MAGEWRLLRLGALEPLKAQALYEAVAIAVGRGLVGRTVILCHPASPYVCIGYHQELEKEVDVDFCRSRGLPIIRRTLGGGATYLDSQQEFYQIVAPEDEFPKPVGEAFRHFLQATVYVYRAFGLPAEYKPLNDVVIGGRKASGNGAGTFEGSAILVGNVILDMNYDMMARVLKVPDEKFRDKLAKSMRDWVTSLKRELGYIPPREKIQELLVEGYEKIGMKLVPGELTREEVRIFEEEVKPRHLSEDWLRMPEMRHPSLGRAVKVMAGVKVVEASHKARKLIRVTMEVAEGKIRDILVSGDFFMLPETAHPKLEETLIGAPLERGEIEKRVEEFYEKFGVQTPGMKPSDFVDAIMKAAELAIE